MGASNSIERQIRKSRSSAFAPEKAIKIVTLNTPNLDTFINFHQLILFEIMSNLPLETIQNLLIVVKENIHVTNTLMLVINSYMNNYINQFNLSDTRYCLTKSHINRPLEKKIEIELIREHLLNYFDKPWYSTIDLKNMLMYLEINPSKEQQIQISHILLAYYLIPIDSNIHSDILPRFYFTKNKFY
jgi:hypothetical protein